MSEHADLTPPAGTEIIVLTVKLSGGSSCTVYRTGYKYYVTTSDIHIGEPVWPSGKALGW